MSPNEAKYGKPGQSWDAINLISMNPNKNVYLENENVTYSCVSRIYVNNEKRHERIVKSSKSTTNEE